MPHESEKGMRSRVGTESEVSFHNTVQSMCNSLDMDDAPYRARLYQLFGLIEKEFDSLYAENCALRAKIGHLTHSEGDGVPIPQESFFGQDLGKGPGSGKKAIQMGQKLRTALRGPPVFRDGSKFRLSRHLEGHRDGVWHVTADVAKNLCASASSDLTARVWSLDSCRCMATYLGHSGSVNCVSFAPGGSTLQVDASSGDGGVVLATASGDESTHVWRMPANAGGTEGSSEEENEDENADTGDKGSDHKSEGVSVRTPLLRLTGHRAPVISCEWLAGGQQIATASWDRTAHIYDVEKGEVLNVLSGHEQELNHCCAHASQKLIATSSKDSTFRLWDFRDSIQSVAVFQGHQESVNSVAFSSGDRIVSSSDDATVKVWDLRNMRAALSTIRLSSAANKVSVSKMHSVIAIPMDNRHVRIYDLAGNRLPRMPNRRCHARMVTACAWVDDHPSHNLLTCGFDRVVATWKVSVTRE